MNHKDHDRESAEGTNDLLLEPELREAIGNFKTSLTTWSENAMSRPRDAAVPACADWTLVTKWALGCAVFIGTVSGGVYQNQRQQHEARIEAARIAEQQRELSAQRAKEEADLMAKVDSDISREVPSALEPLASLMDENQGTGN